MPGFPRFNLKISIKSILINLGLFSMGLILVWLAFRGQNFEEIWLGLRQVHYIYVFYSLIFLAISHFARGLRWNQLILPLGYKPSPWQAFQAVMIGYLANLALPRVGEITRCGILNRSIKAPLNELIGTVIVERVWDLLSLFGIIVLAFIFEYQNVSGFFYENIWLRLNDKSPEAAHLWIFLGVFILGIIFFYWVWIKIRAQIRNSLIFNKIKQFILGLWNGIQSFRQVKNKGLFFIYTLIIWGGYAVSTWILFYAVNATQFLGFKSALLVLAVGAMGMVAPVQGGIGAYHWMVSHALQIYNISLASGLIYATLNHSSGLFLIILIGTISLFSFFWKNANPIENK